LAFLFFDLTAKCVEGQKERFCIYAGKSACILLENEQIQNEKEIERRSHEHKCQQFEISLSLFLLWELLDLWKGIEIVKISSYVSLQRISTNSVPSIAE
jgi:hypothetical protein